MRVSHVQFHLFARRWATDDGGGFAPRWAVKPMVVEAGQILRLSDDARVSDDVEAARLALQIAPTGALTPRILVVGLRGHRALVNGCRAPSTVIVRAGDEIELDGLDEQPWRLHVSLYRTSAIGPAGDELSGRECPLCLGRFSAENRVYRCACGSALHAAEAAEAAAAAGELDCARAATRCPDCRRAVVLESGYEELPRDESGREILSSRRAEHGAANA